MDNIKLTQAEKKMMNTFVAAHEISGETLKTRFATLSSTKLSQQVKKLLDLGLIIRLPRADDSTPFVYQISKKGLSHMRSKPSNKPTQQQETKMSNPETTETIIQKQPEPENEAEIHFADVFKDAEKIKIGVYNNGSITLKKEWREMTLDEQEVNELYSMLILFGYGDFVPAKAA